MIANSMHEFAESSEPSEIVGVDILTPTQSRAFHALERVLEATHIAFLTGKPGVGKSTVLSAFAKQYGGQILRIDDVMRMVLRRDINAAEDSLIIAIEQALDLADLVLVDDALRLLHDYVGRCGYAMAQFNINALFGKIFAEGKRVIFTGDPQGIEVVIGSSPNRGKRVEIAQAKASDYRAFFGNYFQNSDVDKIDFDIIFRHAAALSCHDLRLLSALVIDKGPLTTEQVIDVIDRRILNVNPALGEIEALSFDSLPGTELIAAKLETHVILPLQERELARRLDIAPKRGVLLYGPPGTGKTSVGRALAHRMGGKFYLIDGSYVTEPPIQFFNKIRSIVNEAKDNAPSVLFVDDADVLFGIEHIAGFSRFLLSLLDGVESENAGKVCLMMTAMDVSKMPSAIVRSGRVELWLETKLPDLITRAAILERWMVADLPGHETIDYRRLADASDGFTPADLRRIVADALALYAADIVRTRSPLDADAYLMRAIADLIDTRARMADNLDDESLRIESLSRASIYAGREVAEGKAREKYGAGIGGISEANVRCVTQGW